jgi:hypothetical protein
VFEKLVQMSCPTGAFSKACPLQQPTDRTSEAIASLTQLEVLELGVAEWFKKTPPELLNS